MVNYVKVSSFRLDCSRKFSTGVEFLLIGESFFFFLYFLLNFIDPSKNVLIGADYLLIGRDMGEGKTILDFQFFIKRKYLVCVNQYYNKGFLRRQNVVANSQKSS